MQKPVIPKKEKQIFGTRESQKGDSRFAQMQNKGKKTVLFS